MRRGLFHIAIVIILLASCKKDDPCKDKNTEDNNSPTPASLSVPAHFFYVTEPFIPEDNPLTVEGIALGKKLFYEKLLSRDNSISCGSCHSPENSFNDKGKAFSAGVDGTLGDRNAMPLYNLAWVARTSKRFNWHGSANSLEEQAFGPVTHAKEMKESWTNVTSKLQNNNEYPPLFNAAFGTSVIDSNLVVKALAQFERTLISGNSRVDKYVQKEIAGLDIEGGPFLTEQEIRGYDLFQAEQKGDCFHCHGGFFNPIWTNNAFLNNGLDEIPDSGLAAVTKDPNDLGKFKTPSLRNLVFTAPYMHDGRFNTLEEVLDFYNDGVKNSPTLDPNQKTRNLNDQEKQDIIAFLKALTDSSFVNNPDFLP